MKRPLLLLAVAALVLASCTRSRETPAPADDKSYSIHFKPYPAEGKSIALRYSSWVSGTVKISPAGTVQQDSRPDRTTKQLYTLTHLIDGGKRPAKYQLAFEEATETDGEQSRALPQQGLPLLFKWMGDGVPDEVSVEGDAQPATARFAAQAHQWNFVQIVEANLDPGKAVKVHEEWPLEYPAIQRILNDKYGQSNSPTTSATARLVRACEKGTSQFGVIEVRTHEDINFWGGFRREPPIRRHPKLVLDAAIDGSSTAAVLTKSTAVMTPKSGDDQPVEKVMSTREITRSAER